MHEVCQVCLVVFDSRQHYDPLCQREQSASADCDKDLTLRDFLLYSAGAIRVVMQKAREVVGRPITSTRKTEVDCGFSR